MKNTIYDVIVVGGGIAGIAAGLSAAREKKSVLLVESSFQLGGLATSGMISIYLPLDDGEGRQVSFGICEELIKLSISCDETVKYLPVGTDSCFAFCSSILRKRALSLILSPVGVAP